MISIADRSPRHKRNLRHALFVSTAYLNHPHKRLWKNKKKKIKKTCLIKQQQTTSKRTVCIGPRRRHAPLWVILRLGPIDERRELHLHNVVWRGITIELAFAERWNAVVDCAVHPRFPEKSGAAKIRLNHLIANENIERRALREMIKLLAAHIIIYYKINFKKK